MVLLRVRRRSLTATMVALVLVPLAAALVGVLGVSGFMYTPQLADTVVVCVVVAAVTVPAGRGGLTLSPGPATEAGLAAGELTDVRYTIQELYFLDPELVN